MARRMKSCPMFDIECRVDTLKGYKVAVDQCPCILTGDVSYGSGECPTVFLT